MMVATLITLAWLTATALTVIANVQWFAKFVGRATPKPRDPDTIDPVDVIGLPHRSWR